MQTTDVLDYLRELFPEAMHYYAGRIDTRQDHCLGVYGGEPLPAVGTVGPRTYDRLPVSLLLYWSKSVQETDAAARLLYDRLAAADHPVIGGHVCPCIELRHSAPADCTRPESPVQERVIEAIIYYNL